MGNVPIRINAFCKKKNQQNIQNWLIIGYLKGIEHLLDKVNSICKLAFICCLWQTHIHQLSDTKEKK